MDQHGCTRYMSCVETDTLIVDKFSGISVNLMEIEELCHRWALILKKDVFLSG